MELLWRRRVAYVVAIACGRGSTPIVVLIHLVIFLLLDKNNFESRRSFVKRSGGQIGMRRTEEVGEVEVWPGNLFGYGQI